MSASQSSGSVACLELPLRKPLEEDSATPLVKWSTSMSTSLLRETETDSSWKHLERQGSKTDANRPLFLSFGVPGRTQPVLSFSHLLMVCWLRLPLRLRSDAGGLGPEPAGQDL